MYDELPTEWRPDDLALLAACGAAIGGRKTAGPTAALDRWKAVHDAVVQWVAAGRPTDTARIEDDLFGLLDPLHRSLVEAGFQRATEAIGEATVDLDPVAARVVSDDRRVVLRVPFQFALTHPAGDVELLRLKTGRGQTTPDEAAVVVLGTDPGDHPGDLLTDPGQVEAIELPVEQARDRIDRMLEVATGPRRPTPTPGIHCWRCDRPAVCGAYPDPWGARVPSSARTLKVSRSTLARLAECERRVAWKAVHQVPTAEPDLFDDPSPRLGVGIAFHRAAAAALLDEDGDAVVAVHATALAPADQDDLLLLWENHRRLAEAEPHPVAVTATEHPFGLTIPISDLDTAVVAIGTIDAAGREADGTPAVVEHRTGGSTEVPDLEAELYAVATHLTTRADRVAVHHHHLRGDPAGACTRRVFGPAELEASLAALAVAARRIAGFDPANSLAPPHRVGAWCTTCPYEATCREWR